MAPAETSSSSVQQPAEARVPQRNEREHQKLSFPGKAPLPSRQPLALKNASTLQQLVRDGVGARAGGSGISTTEHHVVTPQQHQQRKLQARLLAGGGSLSASSSGTPIPHKHTSHYPSPLGALQRDDSQRASTSQLLATLTPRKRTAPFDDILQSRMASRLADTSSTQSPRSNKRSRSSKTDSNSNPENASTSTSGAGANLAAVVQEARLTDSPAQSQEPSVTQSQDVTLADVTEVAVTASTSSQVPRPTTTGPPPRPKTKRIDKKSRMTDEDRLRREQSQLANQLEWRRRYIKAFPSFTFYLDGFDAAQKDEVMSSIQQLGGSVEPFFSNTVTHLLTARRVSLPPKKEQKTSSEVATSSRSTNLASSLHKKHAPIPLHSDRNPFEDNAPPVASNDILVKARSFGIKVWTFDKFSTIIKGLHGVDAKALDEKQQQLNLSQMLEKEKLHGSLDRDPHAARNDYYYFSRNSVYILIEDSTSEHRPIMLQEWKKPAAGVKDEEVPWPVLYGELEGKCPFTKYDYEGDPYKRVKPNRHETLRRAVSLNHMRLQQHRVTSLSPAPSGDSRGGYGVMRDASPYPLASGNSMSIASGIASTTSTAFGSTAGSALLSPFGPLGRQVSQTSIGMGRPTGLPSNFPTSRGMATGSRLSPFVERPRAEKVPGSLMRRSFAVAKSVLGGNAQNRSVSTPNAGEAQEREKKPGYCENCRVKYDDFDEHISGRRHRKFAKDDTNFAEIDGLLNRIARPLAAWASASVSDETSHHTPASSRTRATDLRGTSPGSSMLAAGASLDEAYGASEHLGNTSFEQHSATQASVQSVNDSIANWQQGTADLLGDVIDEDTFIDHDEYLVHHEDDEVGDQQQTHTAAEAFLPGTAS